MKQNTSGCLEHLRKRNDLLFSPQGVFADVFESGNTAAIHAWFQGKKFPVGEDKLRLLYFLLLLGYEPEEIEGLDESLISLMGIIAFRILSVEKANEKIGYADSSQVTKIISGGINCPSDKLQLIQDISNEYANELERKKAEALATTQNPKKYKFHGNVEDCLKHFLEHEKDGAKEIVSSLSVTEKTVKSWGEILPRGKVMIGLIAFLSSQDYGVEEFLRLPSFLQKILFLLGLNIFDYSTMIEELGYKTDKDLLRILSLDVGLTPEKRAKAIEIGDAMEDLVQERIKEINPGTKSEESRKEDPPAPSPAENQTLDMTPSEREDEEDLSAMEESMVHLLQAILPLAEILIADDTPKEIRDAVRKSLPRKVLLRVTTALNRLASERAR